MNKINENDILETTLSIAENEYSEAYRSFMGIRRTVHRQEQIWNRSLEKTASGKFHGKGTKPGLSQNCLRRLFCGAELNVTFNHVFTKSKSNALTSEAFVAFIQEHSITSFYVVGADAVACIKSTISLQEIM